MSQVVHSQRRQYLLEAWAEGSSSQLGVGDRGWCCADRMLKAVCSSHACCPQCTWLLGSPAGVAPVAHALYSWQGCWRALVAWHQQHANSTAGCLAQGCRRALMGWHEEQEAHTAGCLTQGCWQALQARPATPGMPSQLYPLGWPTSSSRVPEVESA